MKAKFVLFLLTALAASGFPGCHASGAEKVVIAYVTSWSDVMPDPQYITHINYAFGHVTDAFNGVRVDNPNRLKAMVALKKDKPSLKVLLSVGGWGSGRFSEMAADSLLRGMFAADCRRVADEFGLDGIDIDWEYPTSGGGGISYSPGDTRNYTLLMGDLRAALGEDQLLTLASSAGAGYIDFQAIEPHIDLVNIMTYDMGGAPKHHSGMYRSSMTGWISCEEAVEAHLKAGVPADKLVFGLPFYGRGQGEISNFINYSRIITLQGMKQMWDDVAQAPYLVNEEGKVVCTYDDKRSIELKCKYIHDKGLRGAMYWDYSGDDAENTLRSTVRKGI